MCLLRGGLLGGGGWGVCSGGSAPRKVSAPWGVSALGRGVSALEVCSGGGVRSQGVGPGGCVCSGVGYPTMH